MTESMTPMFLKKLNQISLEMAEILMLKTVKTW